MDKVYSQIYTEDCRPFKEESTSICREFSEDIEKIIFCKSFRRLEHKAQIYSHEKGDHFRTRLTHTLEVSQIARTLAKSLNLNTDLAEAIALGHDVGHTPFGHQGERTIDDIMSGKDSLDQVINRQIQFKNDVEGNLSYEKSSHLNYGGFKHNYNSLRTLDCLEINSQNNKGLNLTWQVIEGILKHTKITIVDDNKEYDAIKNLTSKISNFDIYRFLSKENYSFYIDKVRLDIPFSVTLEGQVACIADEIAQLQHDLDDGFRDKELQLNITEIADKIAETLKTLCIKFSTMQGNVYENLIKYSKKIDLRREYDVNYLIENIRHFFLNDVIENSKLLIEDINYAKFGISRQVDTKVVDFSPIGKEMCERIKSIIGYSILNSYNVTRFDLKAKRIVRELFKAYYDNPLLMPKNVLNRIVNEVKKNQVNLYSIKFKFPQLHNRPILSLDEINLDNSNKDDINLFFSVLKLELFNIRYLFYFSKESIVGIDWNNFVLVNGNMNKPKRDLKLNPYNLIKDNSFYGIYNNETKLVDYKNKNVIDWEGVLFKKCLIENHFVYLSLISDYISGMTDNFAEAEYEAIYMISK